MLGRFAALLPLQLAQLLAGFGALYAFTRLMAPEEYGAFALVWVAGLLAHSVALHWAEAAAFRFHNQARSAGRFADHIATLLAIATFASFGVAFAVWLTLELSHFPNGGPLMGLAGAVTFFRFLQRLAREGERADHRIARLTAFESLYLIGSFALGVVLVKTTDLGAAAPYAGLLAVGFVVALFDGRNLLRMARGGRATASRAQSYFAYGWPLALSVAFDLALQTAARGYIAAESGAADAGAYAAAYGLARILEIMFLWGGAALSPLLLTAYEHRGLAEARATAREAAGLLCALTIPAAVALIMLAAPLSEVMIGPALRAQTAALLPALVVIAFALGWTTHYFAEAFQLSRRSLSRVSVMAGPALAFVIAAPIFARTFGAIGVAWLSAAIAVSAALLIAWVGRRYITLPLPWADLAKSTIAAALMAFGMSLAPDDGGWLELLTKAALGAVIYLNAAYVLDVAHLRRRLIVRNAPAEAAP